MTPTARKIAVAPFSYELAMLLSFGIKMEVIMTDVKNVMQNAIDVAMSPINAIVAN